MQQMGLAKAFAKLNKLAKPLLSSNRVFTVKVLALQKL